MLEWILTYPGVTDKAATYLIYNGRETGAVTLINMRAATMNRDLKEGRDCLRLKTSGLAELMPAALWKLVRLGGVYTELYETQFKQAQD